MPPLFADTCYWIALLVARDALHVRALRLSDQFAHRQIITSEMVLTELLNGVSRYGVEVRDSAVTLIEGFESKGVKVEPQTSEQFWDAVAYYNSRLDQQWGLVDCASFLIMESYGIQEALTNDHHFTQAGFTILM